MDFISDIGGFLGIFMGFGSFILQFYTPNIFKAAIVKTAKMVDIQVQTPSSNLLNKATAPGDVTIGE